MNEPLKYFVKELIDKELGYDVSIEKGISIGGGCINNACLVKTNIGECYFLKYNESVSPKMFEAEAIGLNELYKADLLRVPRVLG
ncbi:MAG: fructosamine kinase family protein, partial [Spirochaetota bacterium]|nr:fructosamine kinase family protein [Spirochaetota bacterium]